MRFFNHFKARIPSLGGQTLRFLFAPQLSSGFGSVKKIAACFVFMLAQVLGSARLLPKSHRSLNPTSLRDARLGEILSLASVNATKRETRLDQRLVFGAVSTLMALTVMMIVKIFVTLYIGVSHAMTWTINFSWGGLSSADIGSGVLDIGSGISLGSCSGLGASTNLFAAPCGASDMAQQWLAMFFLPSTTVSWSNSVMSLPVREGLYSMFALYSTAMLVVAGFLVLYHLITIVAATAHEGKLGGRQMNQVWAPIRLVFAIGLLVPLGIGNGFNSGQMMVLYITQWGSALASNVWATFADTFSDQTGAFVIAPPMPSMAPVLKDALKILTCQAGYNVMGAKSGGFEVVMSEWVANGPVVTKSWTYQDGSDREVGVCGIMEMVNPGFGISGGNLLFLSSDGALTTSQLLRKQIIEAHLALMDEALQSGTAVAPTCQADGTPTGGSVMGGGTLWSLANKFYWSANGGETCYRLTVSDLKEFGDAVDTYRKGLNDAVVGILTDAEDEAANMAVSAHERGWVSAGVWFNSIARINGLLIDFTQEVPVLRPTLKDLLGGDFADKITLARQNVDVSIAGLSTMVGGNYMNSSEAAYATALGSGSAGSSMMDAYLKILGINLSSVAGATSGSDNEVSSGTTSSPIFRLNTANPLAELSALGHRVIDLAVKTTRSLTQCMNTAKSNPAQTGGSVGDQSACSGISSSGNTGEGLILSAVVGALISGGVTLAFMLPLIPFIRFMFGILTWILSIFEAIIAVPIVAIAHIRIDGEGLSGPLARSAYMLVLQVFLRPAMMIFGMIVALLIFNLIVMALNEFYSLAVQGVENSGKLGAISGVIYTVMYAAMAYGFANASFKAIDMIPSRALQWIGGGQQAGMEQDMFVVNNAVSRVGAVGQSLYSPYAAMNKNQAAAMHHVDSARSGAVAPRTPPSGAV